MDEELQYGGSGGSDDGEEAQGGAPEWMVTFADMMTLLMCFFVLLLSFAEVDAIRFKKMAESMKDAFGVQREVPANEIVMGTSVIMQEFSPSTTQEPSPINEVRQQTQEEQKQNLKVEEGAGDEGDAAKGDLGEAAEQLEQLSEQQAQQRAADLSEALQKEIEEGLVSVETEAANVIIRIQEKGSFSSGSARLDPGFLDVMERISDAVVGADGRVVVAGHTDNVPINTSRFRSNWELSSARAVTVVHALLQNPRVDPARVLVEGHADSQPLVPNDSAENRARNRRVELIIEQGQDIESPQRLIISDPDN